MDKTPFERDIVELLGHLVYSHTFRTYEAKERCTELLHKLSTEDDADEGVE